MDVGEQNSVPPHSPDVLLWLGCWLGQEEDSNRNIYFEKGKSTLIIQIMLTKGKGIGINVFRAKNTRKYVIMLQESELTLWVGNLKNKQMSLIRLSF